MKVAIMQPYIFPYIGYFQLINAVDIFVIYDNIEYTKKGWINRNRILVNGKDSYFTIPLKKSSDYDLVSQRKLSENYLIDGVKISNKIENCYKKAPYFKSVFPFIKSVFLNKEENLFKFIYFSISEILNYLEIDTHIKISSEIQMDHNLKSQDKVITICKEIMADEYINPIGGKTLYSKNDFKEENININFLQSNPINYKQFDNDFIPWLSIIDVLMFNSKSKIQEYLNDYSLQ